jgi:two-component system CheB/CheR fusion protein
VLIAELQHRTRNLLAVVDSIAAQTLPAGPQRDAFTARLAALGRLQGLLGKPNGDHIGLGDIVRFEVETIAGAGAPKVTIEEPEVPLALTYVQTVALVVHELATNAVKYGALSSDDGHLDVRWQVERHGPTRPPLLTITWKESGLRTPPNPTRRGYGRQLIEEALAFALRAKTELRFEADGVRCHIDIPVVYQRGLPTSET